MAPSKVRTRNPKSTQVKTKNPTKLYSLLATALVAVGMVIPRAQAQQPSPPVADAATVTDDTVVQLESFVVMAQKVARPLNEVPASVVPISGDTLTSLKLFDAKDIVSVAPGLMA